MIKIQSGGLRIISCVKKGILFYIILSITSGQPLKSYFCQKKYLSNNKKGYLQKELFTDLLYDMVLLNKNLFTIDSYKIFVTMFPFYIAARMTDRRIQRHFHCRDHHKNICQMPHWCNNFARFGMAIPIIALGSLAFLSSDEDLRTTSWIFILGIPFLIFGNKITKKIRFEACYRPWHEDFSHVQRSPGGFPSGHAAYVTYMTVLYGLRYGPRWFVPLALYSIFVGINFCVSNRHYLSQIIAGIGLGTMYAYAANKLIESKLLNKVHITCGLNSSGNPAIGISYTF